MSTFSKALDAARDVMDRGGFREAFTRVVDIPVSRPDELFSKIALMADAGIALRDGSILEYGLYLLEHHSADILVVPSFAPFLWLNIANLRANLLAVREAEGGHRCWYERKQTAPAREAYVKAYDSAGDDEALKARILTAHARLLMGLGRDWEAFGLFHKAAELDPDDEFVHERNSRLSISTDGKIIALALRHKDTEHLYTLFTVDRDGNNLKVLKTNLPMGIPVVSKEMSE